MTKRFSPDIALLSEGEGNFYDAEMKALADEFASWQDSTERGTKHLWATLGKIYELAPRIESDSNAKLRLISELKEDPNIKDNARWKAERKSPHELLAAKLLSIDEATKATKSQWISALKAARNGGVATTQNAFVEFLGEVGGVSGARRSVVKPKAAASDFSTLAHELKQVLEGALHSAQALKTQLPEFIAPTISVGNDVFPDEIALVLVRGTEAGALARPIVTICDEALILKVMMKFFSEAKATEKAGQKDAERLFKMEAQRWLRVFHQKMKSKYKEIQRKGGYVQPYYEFVGEVIEGEDLDNYRIYGSFDSKNSDVYDAIMPNQWI